MYLVKMSNDSDKLNKYIANLKKSSFALFIAK